MLELSIVTIVLAILNLTLTIRLVRVENRLSAYKAIANEALKQNLAKAARNVAEINKAFSESIEAAKGESQSSSIIPISAQGEPPLDDDGLWQFAEENRDLMAQWLLKNPHIAPMQPHRRYSEWATFCGNLPERSRIAIELALDQS